MNRPASRTMGRISGIALLLALLFAPLADAASLQEDVTSKSTELAARKNAIAALTEQERSLHKDLAKLETSVKDAATALDKLEKDLTDLKARQATGDIRLAALLAARDTTSARLAELMQTLWPVYLKAKEEGFASAEKWAEANRKAEWLAALYREAQGMREDIERQSQVMADEQSRLDEAAATIDAQLGRITDSRAALQKKQANYEARIKDIRTKRAQGEKEVQNLLGSIASLRHQISLQAAKQISKQQGALPWPAKGRMVTPFAPDGNPPSNGIGLALTPGAPVRSVSWGKVVHNDQLRGFGQVVVIFHGEDYYSLYAFLADTSVTVGREVSQGDQIGVSGFYPKAQGPGLYFELRFRQKAINPLKWLQSG